MIPARISRESKSVNTGREHLAGKALVPQVTGDAPGGGGAHRPVVVREPDIGREDGAREQFEPGHALLFGLKIRFDISLVLQRFAAVRGANLLHPAAITGAA